MKGIKYNAEIKFTSIGFDIVFDKTILSKDWQMSIAEHVLYNLLTNKRLEPYMGKNEPHTLQGGYIGDYILNKTGKLSGSYVLYNAGRHGSLAEKDKYIQDAMKETLTELKNNQYIDSFDIRLISSDIVNGILFYQIIIDSNINVKFSIYANKANS